MQLVTADRPGPRAEARRGRSRGSATVVRKQGRRIRTADRHSGSGQRFGTADRDSGSAVPRSTWPTPMSGSRRTASDGGRPTPIPSGRADPLDDSGDPPRWRPIVLGAAAGTLGGRFLLRTVGLKRLGRVVGTTGSARHHRERGVLPRPIRVRPLDTGLVVAPADGLVSLIENAAPPAELGLSPAPRTRVSIFLSIFDVHVQRIPVDGVITGIAYHPGKFLSADLDKASEVNERNSLVIRTVAGDAVLGDELVGDAGSGTRGSMARWPGKTW